MATSMAMAQGPMAMRPFDADFLVTTRGVEGGAGVARGGGGAQGGGGAHRSLAEFIVYLRAGWCEVID